MDRKPVSVKSYANIAIVKYWGKADAERMIPSTSSISLTLENMYTETKLSFLPEDATGMSCISMMSSKGKKKQSRPVRF